MKGGCAPRTSPNPPGLERPPLSRLLATFQARHPDCLVILHEVDTGDPYTALRHGEVDVLVLYGPVRQRTANG
jgi:DNA-binding transcriptional LysR family regulator